MLYYKALGADPDLRSLNIMPAAIMVHDKILRSILISILHPNLNENAFDCIDRTILRNKINKDEKIKEIEKSLLNNILTIYDSISINILEEEK